MTRQMFANIQVSLNIIQKTNFIKLYDSWLH